MVVRFFNGFEILFCHFSVEILVLLNMNCMKQINDVFIHIQHFKMVHWVYLTLHFTNNLL